ncbi:MAG: amidohydrolase family protein, partial [Steroidobacter sp.]
MRKLLALLLTMIPTWVLAAAPPNAPSAVIANVIIVDGTGAPARKGAVRIANGRIVDVGDVTPGSTEIVIDGGGKTLAPGFIDTHSHHDEQLAESRDLTPAISQGITTIIIGQDGMSETPLKDFFTQLEDAPASVNIGSYSGHNTLREKGMAAARRPATDDEIARMSKLLEDDIAAGALGLSSGLEYESGNFSTPAEVQALAQVSARLGGRYSSHIRDEEGGLMSALQEVIDIGRQTHAPVHVSHLKIAARKLWGSSDKVLKLLDDARASGVDVTADVYPYTYWQSTMRVMFPNKVFDDRKELAATLERSTPADGLYFVRYAPDPSIVGSTLAEIAKKRGTPAVETYIQLMKVALDYQVAHPNEEHIESIIGFSMNENDVARLLAWEHTNICSDGAAFGHPRGHGTFPRVLGHYVREKKVLTLEQAIHKMTGLPAKHLG